MTSDRFAGTVPLAAASFRIETTTRGLLTVKCESFRSGLTYEEAELDGRHVCGGYFPTSNIHSLNNLVTYVETFAHSVHNRLKADGFDIGKVTAWYSAP